MDLSELPALPLLIFLAELSVVTLGTMRIIFLARGMRMLAPVLGFFEVCIWLFAVGQIMRNLNNLGCYFAFAAGFTMGNFLGIFLEKRLALGKVVIHVITARDAAELLARLRSANYGVTLLEGRGGVGPVKMVMTAIPRKDMTSVLELVKEFDPHAFYAVHDLQAAAAGIFPGARGRLRPRGEILRAVES
jgi:uncharacterized protein YebE (UPF0316 family)